MAIPAGSAVVTLIRPDRNGVFKLAGPAPLQFAHSVACGDAGCIYNHLDWGVGTGASVVSGCQGNMSRCAVRIIGGSVNWTPVLVRQNNDPALVYLLWQPAGPPPTVAVDVAANVPAAGLPIGQSAPVVVTVIAGAAPLSSVDVSSLVSSNGNVRVVGPPPGGLSGFALGAGASRSFTFMVKAISIDKAIVSARVRASTPTGAASGSGSDTVDVFVAAPDGIDWHMLAPTTADVPHDAGNDLLGVLSNADIYRPLVVHLILMKNDAPYRGCTARTIWKWTVTAKTSGTRVLRHESGPLVGCSVNVFVSGSGVYTAVANEYLRGSRTPLHPPVIGDVHPKNLLILAMGDSNGSGEGDPPFYFDQCNRGVASYQYQAAQLLEEQAQSHAAATFVSASCSGARIQHLVDTRYEGIRPGALLTPQIAQLGARLTPPSGVRRRAPDALVVSIGVNDLAFGPILKYCVEYYVAASASGVHGIVPPCQTSPVSTTLDNVGRIAKFSFNLRGQPLATIIDGLVAQLPQRYDALAASLTRSGITPAKNVYLSQYPEFWFGNGSTTCGGTELTSFSPYPQTVWAWLGTEGEKLNAAVAAAAAAHSWTTIPVPESAFYDHGYCQISGSYFVPLTRAAFHNLDGAFHPTARGAHVTAVETLMLLCPLLEDPKRCSSFPTP